MAVMNLDMFGNLGTKKLTVGWHGAPLPVMRFASNLQASVEISMTLPHYGLEAIHSAESAHHAVNVFK